ncbi:MAG: cation:proton antiporter [Limisphaerales bacterium]
MSNTALAIQLFAQIAIILTACQIVGLLARRLGQPQVVGEMITGVLLGPSLLGLFLPGLASRLFPADSMKVLFPTAQLGLAAYMFVVGLEFRMDIIRRQMTSAIAVSAAGMAAPFILGAALASYLHGSTTLFPERTGRMEAMVFLGASMCITAFPMLARIIHHKNLAGTTMGTVALGAGALDDAAAWCLLALVLGSFDGDMSQAFTNIGGGFLYVAVTLGLIRPALGRWAVIVEREGVLSDRGFGACMILLAFGAWATDALGLHAVFGAFVMGAAMPRGLVAQSLQERVEPLTVGLLLPLFFAFSGLNTEIGLLDSGKLWFIAGLVMAAAVAGKGVACWIAARATGIAHREALGIGTLMNARGLMELIIINIGLQRNIISPALFATLVLMAVITTLIASPIFEALVGRHRPKPEPEPEPEPEPGTSRSIPHRPQDPSSAHGHG